MRDKAKPRAAPRRRPAQKATSKRQRASAPARALTDSDSLLDHLDDAPETLSAAWDAARQEPIPLPHRAALEERLGRDLDGVQAFAGPQTESLLDRLGAAAATRGDEVLLRGPDAPLAVVAHEVAHALDAAPAPEGAWAGVVEASGAVEQAADRIAAEMVEPEAQAPDGTPDTAAATPKPGWVALLRDTQAEAEIATTGPDAPTVPQPIAVDDPQPEPEPPAPEDPTEDTADTPPAADTATTAGENPQNPDAQPRADAAPQPDTGRAPPATDRDAEPAPLAPGPDRRKEMTELRDAGQDAWDKSSGKADRHETRNCPCGAVRDNQRPFQRGPPVTVPPTRTVPEATAAEPNVNLPTDQIRRAETAVSTSLARGPPRPERHNGAARQNAEIAAVEREIARDGGPTVPETPSLALTGNLAVSRITERETNLKTTLTTQKSTALTGTEVDFGETVLAPATDPTTGHDTTLDNLEIPQVSLQDHLRQATLDRIATDDNAGTLPIDQALVTSDESMATARERMTREKQRKSDVDGQLTGADTALSRLCDTACTARDTQLSSARDGVGQRRTKWRKAVESKANARKTEGETLARARRTHVETLERNANRQAGERMRTARTQGAARWREAQSRAENKTQEGRNPSLWERGVAAFRSALNTLKNWVTSFLDGCRRAIGALLEAGRAAAKAIVDAGQAAATATINATRATLDALADNLPGELGAIVSDFRDDAHDFLDGVQTRVDSAADTLREGIDTTIDDLQDGLDDVFETFKDGVEGVADFLDDAAQSSPLMAVLRRISPALADLVESGLDSLSDRAAETLQGWIDGAFAATGLNDLTAWLEGLEASSPCGVTAEENEQRTCDGFNALMAQASDWVGSLLDSPAAQAFQAKLQAGQDAVAEQQVDQLSSFLGFIQSFAQPLYQAWQTIEAGAQRVLEAAGDVGRTIWRQVASFLGIDINLSPLEALRRGIEALWQVVVDAVQPMVAGLRAAWRWLREATPLGAFLDLIAKIPALWQALTDLAGNVVEGIENAMVRAAAFFRETLLPVVERALSVVSGVLTTLVDAASAFADAMLGALEALLSIEFGLAILDVLKNALARLVAPILAVMRLLKACVIMFWRALATVVGDLLRYVRTFLDICVGLVAAFAAPPITFVTFLAGAVWLHVVPTCFKAPILNFFLDVGIRVLRFLPAPANFVLGAIYHGLMAFLETLRAAADNLKVKAINLFASLFAGNVELAAGVLVGLARGVWESTGGTIIFIGQAVAWLAMLPVKLVRWVAGLGDGTTDEPGIRTARGPPQGQAGDADDQDAVADADPTPLGRSADASGQRATAAPDPGVPARTAGETDTPRPLAGERGVAAPLSLGAEDARAARAEPDDAAERAEEQAGSLGPATAEEEAAEEDTADTDTPDVDTDNASDADDGEGPATVEPDEGAADTQTAPAPATDLRAPITADSAGPQPAPTPAAPLRSEPGAGASAQTAEPDTTPPTAPNLPSLSDILRQLATTGMSREDVRNLLNGLRGAVAGVVRPLASKAATALLNFLAAPGTAFRIGAVVGTIAGMLIVEIALAVLSGGASTAITGAKAVLLAARGTARLASIVARLRRMLAPLFRLLGRLKRTATGLLGQIMRWLDNVVQWMQRMLRRFLGRRRPPRATGPPRARPRPHGGRRPPRQAGSPPGRPARPGKPRRPRRPGKPRKPKKPKKGGALRAKVAMAARAGWARVKAMAGGRVMAQQPLLKAARSAAKKAARGVAIRVAARKRSKHLWSLRVTGRRRGKRASATKGRGWFGRDKQRRAHYSGATDQTAVHRRIGQRFDDAMDTEIAKVAPPGEKTLREAHRALIPVLKRMEKRPRPAPLGGIKVDIKEQAYRPEEKRDALVYEVEIGPNTATMVVRAERPGESNSTETQDKNHPAIRHIKPFGFGPYIMKSWDYRNRQKIKRPATPRTDKIPSVMIPKLTGQYAIAKQSAAAINRRWAASLAPPWFTPDRVEYDKNQKKFFRTKTPSKTDHPTKNRLRTIRQNVVKGANMNRVDRIADENLRTPRRIDLDKESGFKVGGTGRTGHTLENHVLGSGKGIWNRSDAAVRSAFELLPGNPATGNQGPGAYEQKGLDGGRTASAFRNRAAADNAARLAHAHLAGIWISQARNHFASTTASLTFNVQVPPASLIAYKRRRKDPYPESDLPDHINYGPRRSTPGTGRRPLRNEDRQPRHRRRHALTDEVTLSGKVLVVLRATDNAGSGGWMVFTMYPVT